MSKILNKAKFLLNGAGSSFAYKEGRMNAVFPTDGSADISGFTGGDGSSRISPSKLVTRVPQNLVSYSSTFGTFAGPWTTYCGNGSVVTNNTTDTLAPDGTFTAVKLARDSATSCGGGGTWGFLYNSGLITRVGEIFTASVWVKAEPGQTTEMRMGFWDGQQGVFNVGDEWERIEFTTTITNVQRGFQVFSVTTNVTYYVWGPMTNEGPNALPYQPTTTRLNIPTVSHGNGRGVWVNEPSRTNLVLDYRNGSYGNSPGSETAVTAPDGTETAVRPVPNATADRYQYTIFGGDYATGTKVTYSWWFKQLSAHKPESAVALNDLPYGVTTDYGIINCTRIVGPYKIETGPDGWVRYGATYEIADGTIDTIFRFYFGFVIGIGNNSAAYWGHQLEVGDATYGGYATSLIPTFGSQVTRTQTSFSSTFDTAIPTGNNDGGTVLFDMEAMASNNGVTNSFPMARFSDGTDYVGISVSAAWRGRITSGGVNYLYSSPVSNLEDAKIAIAFDNFGWEMWANGSQWRSGTDNIAIGSFSDFLGNGNNRYGVDKFKTVAAFDERLSTTDLQELTSMKQASGGNKSFFGPYTIHKFLSSGTFTPSFSGEVELLIVAAGGGGGGPESNPNGGGGGGGGAGGVVYYKSYPVTSGINYTVIVGSGGSGGTTNQNNAANGSDSSFGDLGALGGGSGGPDQNASPRSGGSGGGAGGDTGQAGAPSSRSGQGNKGGDDLSSSRSGGGGGGAGGAGENATDTSGTMQGTAGGIGKVFDIDGTPTYYAGGGGGGGSHNFSGTTPNTGVGGLGGGGNSIGLGDGGVLIYNFDGAPNTGGGGGGGAAATTAGNGGSGIVIVRYLS